MKLNNKIKPFPSYLSDHLKEILETPKPLRSDGIIFKREPHKLSEDELNYLADNGIPY